jgi:D-lactate dehydrogenase (cytochrome)
MLKNWLTLYDGPRQVSRFLRYSSTPSPRLPWAAYPGQRRLISSQLQTQSNVTGDRGGKTTSRVLFFLTSIASGLAGYAIAHPASAWTTKPSKNAQEHEPRYGTPADFKKAIEELRSTFSSEDSVSTDPDDLYTHGFSEYDYHPGVASRIQQRVLMFMQS